VTGLSSLAEHASCRASTKWGPPQKRTRSAARLLYRARPERPDELVGGADYPLYVLEKIGTHVSGTDHIEADCVPHRQAASAT
jgi:hypothetical protein